MTVDDRIRLGDTTHAPAQWAANLLGPLAVLLGQTLAYAFVDPACTRGAMPAVHAVFAGTLVIALAGGAIAWREWARWDRTPSTDGGDPESRSRFMLVIGLSISVFSALVVAAQWAATAFLHPCQ